MISHVTIGVNDFGPAFDFYAAIMRELGLALKFCEPQQPWAAWFDPAAARPLLIIGRAFDGHAATAGNGSMVALLAPSRAAVERCHALALELGGQCEGVPGLRAHYHANFYGAYFRDLDGNKLCVCHHDGADPLV